MQQILAVTTPFFALVLMGWAAVRLRTLPLDAIAGLNAFVLFFALPCMLLRFAANTPITQLLDPAVVAVYLVGAVLMVGGALAVARRQGRAWPDAAFGALLAAFPNSGFMGVPLLVALLGNAAAAPAIVALALDMVLTTSVCIAVSQLGGGAGGAAVGRALRGMLKNPLPWAITLGSVSSATGWRPGPAWLQPVEMLAGAASPVALFALGAMLARRQMLAAGEARSAQRREALDVAGLVGFKLVVHPLAVFAAGQVALAAGAPLTPFAAMVLVLIAALPGASNVPMLAERYHAEAGRLARMVLYSTLLAFASFPLAVALLQAHTPR